MISLSSCPYCKVYLAKTPKRKTKCSNCGNFIYIKTDPVTRLKRLVTDKDAEVIDKEWSRNYSLNNSLRKLSPFGITKEYFLFKKKLLSDSFGFEARDRDVTWALLNEAIIGTKDFQKLKMIYFTQALMLYEEDKDFSRILLECRRSELFSYKKFRYNKKVKILSGRGCESCNELNNKIFEIDEALGLMPLPYPNCTHNVNSSGKGWCRCCYVSGDDPSEQLKRINEDFYKNLSKC